MVVLSDGEDTLGRTCLDELVTMESTSEADVTYCAKRDPGQLELTDFPRGADGERVDVGDVSGAESKLPGGVQVFFIGFGSATSTSAASSPAPPTPSTSGPRRTWRP